eukprot:maker-scaffold483_size159862-snap-gene-0.36 protein:Tk08694 transcript:maker-scaffold483_size159862-snap-gene-0.36-mRNA-1 annotation:"olfactory ionotropic receptor ir93a"
MGLWRGFLVFILIIRTSWQIQVEVQRFVYIHDSSAGAVGLLGTLEQAFQNANTSGPLTGQVQFRATNNTKASTKDVGCERSEYGTSTRFPRVGGTSQMLQLSVDLLMSGQFPWKSVNLFSDGTLPEKELGFIKEEFSKTMAVALHQTSADTDMKMAAEKMIAKGNNILVVSKDAVPSLINMIQEMNLFSIDSHFLFLIPDASMGETNFASALTMVKDGANVAFAFNSSGGSDCQTISMCLETYAPNLFVDTWVERTEALFKRFENASQDEYNLMKPSQSEQIMEIMTLFRAEVNSQGGCNSCQLWTVQAAEILGPNRVKNLDVATWNPQMGFTYSD